jgi:hypothetical protein
MRPIETIDVSLPRASTGTQKAATAAGDLALALFLTLILPLVLTALFSPVAAAIRAILSFAGLI